MEIQGNHITVTGQEIITTVDRIKIEGKVSEILRQQGVLIDPSDMRSPITIAESMGMLQVDNKV